MAKTVMFGEFEFPVLKGMDYLHNEGDKAEYLFINETHEKFSMYFEDGMEKFTVPEKSKMDRAYCLFELNSNDRKIHFFCPEKWKHLNSVIWYFYVELTDESGSVHCLPGQVRVLTDSFFNWVTKTKPKFIKILEQISLRHDETYA